MTASQRFALGACGRDWIRLGSRKSPKPENYSKKPQNPTSPLHALLGAVEFKDSLVKKRLCCEYLSKLYNQLTRFLHTSKSLATVFDRRNGDKKHDLSNVEQEIAKGENLRNLT
jgi:hypothetical protein